LFYLEFPVGDRTYEIIFRPMTLAETKAVSLTGSAMAILDLNDLICSWCIVYANPAIDERVPAALPDIVAQRIIEASGFNDQDNFVVLLNEARETTSTVEVGIEIFICKAFPGTKPRDVQNMTIYDQMEMLARAEIVLGTPLELGKTPTQGKKRLSPDAAAILSRDAADIPNPKQDNVVMDQFLTGKERLMME
jgi:hypothetical protein